MVDISQKVHCDEETIRKDVKGRLERMSVRGHSNSRKFSNNFKAQKDMKLENDIFLAGKL